MARKKVRNSQEEALFEVEGQIGYYTTIIRSGESRLQGIRDFIKSHEESIRKLQKKEADLLNEIDRAPEVLSSLKLRQQELLSEKKEAKKADPASKVRKYIRLKKQLEALESDLSDISEEELELLRNQEIDL